jgi:hypothetical protein
LQQSLQGKKPAFAQPVNPFAPDEGKRAKEDDRYTLVLTPGMAQIG